MQWKKIAWYIILFWFLAFLGRLVAHGATISINERNVWHLLDHLIQCESGGKNVKKLDTNGKYSFGPLQFQRSTWESFGKESGFHGDPMNRADAIQMGRWALLHGKEGAWATCYRVAEKKYLNTFFSWKNGL